MSTPSLYWTRSGTSSHWSSVCMSRDRPRSNFRVSLTTHAAAFNTFNTRCSLSAMIFGAPLRKLHCSSPHGITRKHGLVGQPTQSGNSEVIAGYVLTFISKQSALKKFRTCLLAVYNQGPYISPFFLTFLFLSISTARLTSCSFNAIFTYHFIYQVKSSYL